MDIKEIPQDRRQRCEVWTRVMGYHRPVDGFNPGKRAEFRERRPFVEPKGTFKGLGRERVERAPKIV